VLWFALAIALPARGQTDPCLQRTVAVSVVDTAAKPVTGLTPQDFHAEMKGKRVPILSAMPDESSHRVLIVLDASKSMVEDEKEWSLAKSLAGEALAASPGHFQAGLIVFNDQVRVKIPVQSGTQAARRALDELPERPRKKDQRIGRHTALWDALMAATELLDPPQFGDSIYAITDGWDNASSKGLKMLRKTLAARGVRVFAEWFGYDVLSGFPGTPEDSPLSDFLAVVGDSGGLLATIPPRPRPGTPLPNYSQLRADQLKKIRSEAQELYTAWQFVYRLDVALPAPVSRPKRWKLSIPQGRSPKPDWVLAFPAYIEACEARH